MKGPSSQGSRKGHCPGSRTNTRHGFSNATDPNTTKPPAVIDVSSRSSTSQTTRNDKDLEPEDDKDDSSEYDDGDGVSTFRNVLMILVTIMTFLPATP